MSDATLVTTRVTTAGALVVALSTGRGGDPPQGTTPDPKEAILALLASPCDDALDDVYDVGVHGDKGTLLACAYERRIDVDEMSVKTRDTTKLEPAYCEGIGVVLEEEEEDTRVELVAYAGLTPVEQ